MKSPIKLHGLGAWRSLDKGIKLVTVGPGGYYSGDVKLAFNISFSEVQTLKHEPIVTVLNKMASQVEGALLLIKQRFFT